MNYSEKNTSRVGRFYFLFVLLLILGCSVYNPDDLHSTLANDAAQNDSSERADAAISTDGAVAIPDDVNVGNDGTSDAHSSDPDSSKSDGEAQDDCPLGFADCDENSEVECETQLAIAVNHCGACGNDCAANLTHAAQTSCTAGTCRVVTCESGWDDCDSLSDNGCEHNSSADGPCLATSDCVEQSFGTHTYYFCPNLGTWSAARSSCQQWTRGDLVSISSGDENDFVKTHIAETAWIGARDILVEGLWRWESNGVPFWRGTANGEVQLDHYENWKDLQPDDSSASQNCAIISDDGTWSDVDCTGGRPFVCEVSPDECEDDPNKYDPGQCGCGVDDTDSDGDGIADCIDECPSDWNKQSEGQCGCGNSDIDSDNDGAFDCNDECPADPNKQDDEGQCGCGMEDSDSDDDGILDCDEICLSDPNKQTAGQCGCGNPDTDSDSDGTADCIDDCPADPDKIAEGQCGCGVTDADSDSDGFLDCDETCDADPNKQAPGQCGCGNPDTDSDSDGTADCIDDCPDDPDKTDPGVCDCGIPDTGSTSCSGLIDALVHRYRFDGTGTAVVDSIGDADGTTNSTLAGDGKLTLAGGSSGEYATLPSGILSSLSAATVEFWLTWQGSSQLQRTISFGTAVPAAVGGSSCNTTSTKYYAGSWYRFCNGNQVVWPTARSQCEGAGGYLAAIESAEEEQYIENNSDFTISVWIGANDKTTEGEWYFATADGLQAGTHFWSGGKNGSAVGGAYENWGSNEPANSDSAADCAFLYHATPRSWMALDGSGYVGNFLCEWRGHRGDSMSRGVWFTPSDSSDRPSLTFKAGNSAVVAQASNAFPVGSETHVALVLDPDSNDVSLYIDGTLAASVSSSDALANLRDADNWLGRSQVTGDPALSGSLSELRVYDSALTPEQIATSHLTGPDPVFLGP